MAVALRWRGVESGVGLGRGIVGGIVGVGVLVLESILIVGGSLLGLVLLGFVGLRCGVG